jgi:hypothetical protein
MGKEKAVYAPGELSRVRNKLGSLDDTEAKRMVKLLGGEVGVEKTPEFKAPPRQPRKPRQDKTAGGGGGPPQGRGQRFPAQNADSDVEDWARVKKNSGGGRGGSDGGDNPRAPVTLSYWERVKMDRYAGQSEFDIKSAGQVLASIFSFFSPPPDLVSNVFVSKRMSEYYKRLETLVTAARTLLPRSNIRRTEILKKRAPFVFIVLEVIRDWNIDKITGDLTKIQSRPRSATVGDFTEILKAIYRPLFMLEQLNTEVHIKGAFKVLYKLVYLENPEEAKEKYQELIRSALVAYTAVRRDIHYLLYPLLMKMLSNRWFSYENFFKERKQRFLAFINADETDRIMIPDGGMTDNVDLRDEEEENAEEEKEQSPEAQEDENDPAVAARRAEKKAVNRGLDTLEILFPKAGWQEITGFPDLYPYFGKMFDLTRGYEQISPYDPLHQVIVLLRILEELFFGLRYVSFGAEAPGLDESEERVDETMTELINNWRIYIEHSYYKEYLPRVREYVRILEGAAESRNSTYAKRLLNELHWAKRLFFLPYYRFESQYPPSFQKKDITSLYPEIRKLRKYLTAVAAGIEQGIKRGGIDEKALCPGINNPWDEYEFQVPNPLSQRLNALLTGKAKNNASLIFYTLAVATVLDYLVNNENSWAYAGERPPPLFRSTEEPEDKDHVDADALFHQSIKEQEKSGDDFVPEPLPGEAGAVPQEETPENSGAVPENGEAGGEPGAPSPKI